MASSSSEKRCLYEILDLKRDCTPEEIRSAYKKQALLRHPDKLIKTGVPEEQATASFQELVNAYEVLSDPRERAWYDSHRSQILFSDAKHSSSSSLPDLFSFFSNTVYSGFGDTRKGFYKVYGDVFGKIYAQEVFFARKMGLGEDSVKDSPLIGNLDSPYEQVSVFYSYWLGFSTLLDFCWVDEYDAMAGPNRKSRRVMEEENKKLRKKARREYNDTVRGLAEFVKKRDKRVIEMQMKKNLELEKKREDEKARRKEAERERLEKARLYEEPEWAKVDEEEELDNVVVEEEADDNKKNELYCVVCSKKFKSEKQWKNHEQSKKHREKVAELRSQMDNGDEQEEEEEEVEEELVAVNTDEVHTDAVNELQEKFDDSIDLSEGKGEVKDPSSHDEETKTSDDVNGDGGHESFGSDEDVSVLKAMASGRNTKKKGASRHQNKFSTANYDKDNEEIDLMEYNNRRSTRRNRAAKKEPVKKSSGEAAKSKVVEPIVMEEVLSNSDRNEGQDLEDNQPASQPSEDSLSHKLEDGAPKSNRDPFLEKIQKVANPQINKKDIGKKDTKTNTKNTSKGKKQKGTSKAGGLSCETCGEDFDSRNKLHKHLGDTGHASLKSR